ncbi:hypothetical protein HRbin06_00247 [archaeon HR06]|nr:hypothetical protein HRbin06_00247 [archaeon HR06]
MVDDNLDSLVRSLVRLLLFPFTRSFDELLIKAIPEELAREHFINARLELLKGIKALIDKRIENYEKLKESLKVKRERVKVE